MEEYLLFLCLCRAWATDWLTPRNSHRSSYSGRCFLKWNGVWFWCLDSIPFWGLGTFTGWLDVFWFNRKRHKITCCERVGTIDINNQVTDDEKSLTFHFSILFLYIQRPLQLSDNLLLHTMKTTTLLTEQQSPKLQNAGWHLQSMYHAHKQNQVISTTIASKI